MSLTVRTRKTTTKNTTTNAHYLLTTKKKRKQAGGNVRVSFCCAMQPFTLEFKEKHALIFSNTFIPFLFLLFRFVSHYFHTK